MRLLHAPARVRGILVICAVFAAVAAAPAAARADGPALGGWAGFFGGPTFGPDDAPIVWRLSGRGAVGHRIAGSALGVDLGVAIDGGYSSQEGPFDSRFRTRYLELGPVLRGTFALSDQLGVYVGTSLAYVNTRLTSQVPILGSSTHDASGYVVRILGGVELGLSDEVRIVIEPLGLNAYSMEEGRHRTDLWSMLVGAVALF